MTDVQKISIKNVSCHEKGVILVFLFLIKIENSLDCIGAIFLLKQARTLTNAFAIRIWIQILFILWIALWIHVVIELNGIFLCSHLKIWGLSIFGKMLIDIINVKATVKTWILIFYVLNIHFRIISWNLHPSGLHFGSSLSCRSHLVHRPFNLLKIYFNGLWSIYIHWRKIWMRRSLASIHIIWHLTEWHWEVGTL